MLGRDCTGDFEEVGGADLAPFPSKGAQGDAQIAGGRQTALQEQGQRAGLFLVLQGQPVSDQELWVPPAQSPALQSLRGFMLGV